MMVNSVYSKAYTEVLEIISYFSKEDYSKIPTEKIEFFKNNMDKTYNFKIDPKIELSEQNISKEANSIIINLYLDYYATETQKNNINEILKQNQKKSDIKKRELYNPDDIFKNSDKDKTSNKIAEDNNLPTETTENSNLPTELKKENFFNKFIAYIKSLLLKLKLKNKD